MAEWMHIAMHQAQQQTQPVRTTHYGHVSTYDPEKHAVKVIIPMLRDEDDEPVETEWIQLGTTAIGDKWGMQWAPKGGATKDEPNVGEQCKITVIERTNGMMAVADFGFNDTMTPPGAGKGETEEEDENDEEGRNKLKGGEFLFRHESGSFVKFYEDGNIQLYSANDLNVRAQQDLNVTVHEGNCNVLVEEGDTEVKALIGNIDCIAELGNITARADVGNIMAHALVGDIEALAEIGNILATAEIGNVVIDVPLGDIMAIAGVGNIIASTEVGEVVVETLEGSVLIQGGTSVNVLSDGLVTINAPLVEAGEGALQQLCNTAMLSLFNVHTHPTGMGETGPPTIEATQGVETTVSFFAG